jgi:hypothetical protein
LVAANIWAGVTVAGRPTPVVSSVPAGAVVDALPLDAAGEFESDEHDEAAATIRTIPVGTRSFRLTGISKD